MLANRQVADLVADHRFFPGRAGGQAGKNVNVKSQVCACISHQKSDDFEL